MEARRVHTVDEELCGDEAVAEGEELAEETTTKLADAGGEKFAHSKWKHCESARRSPEISKSVKVTIFQKLGRGTGAQPRQS